MVVVFAYTADSVYEIKGRLYQVEDKVKRRTICRVSKTMLVNVEHITSVQDCIERKTICQNGKR